MGRGKLPEVKLKLLGEHVAGGGSTSLGGCVAGCLTSGQYSPALHSGGGEAGYILPGHSLGQDRGLSGQVAWPSGEGGGWGEQGLQGEGVLGISVSGPPGWETFKETQEDVGPLMSVAFSWWADWVEVGTRAVGE